MRALPLPPLTVSTTSTAAVLWRERDRSRAALACSRNALFKKHLRAATAADRADCPVRSQINTSASFEQ